VYVIRNELKNKKMQKFYKEKEVRKEKDSAAYRKETKAIMSKGSRLAFKAGEDSRTMKIKGWKRTNAYITFSNGRMYFD
jgi:hypothetical protein